MADGTRTTPPTTPPAPRPQRVSPETLITADETLGRWARMVHGLIDAYPKLIPFAWVFLLLFWGGSLALCWACWFVFIPELWDGAHGLGAIAGALVGTVFLAVIPIWAWMLAYTMMTTLFEATTGGGEKDRIARARERVRETEEDTLRRLEKTDEAGLLPMLRYSRAQLDAYYVMGLGQTRRAFLNAALAMWLGFLLLLAGIALYIGPVEQLGLSRPSGDFHWLILASAIVIEVVSALFLWVYRSTIGQLTFYYRLQMQNHTAIMCYRIANTMKDADPAKRAVIDKLLSAGPDPERPPPMSAKGLVTMAATGGG